MFYSIYIEAFSGFCGAAQDQNDISVPVSRLSPSPPPGTAQHCSTVINHTQLGTKNKTENIRRYSDINQYVTR